MEKNTYYMIISTRKQCDQQNTAAGKTDARCYEQVLRRIDGDIFAIGLLLRTVENELRNGEQHVTYIFMTVGAPNRKISLSVVCTMSI